MGDIFMLFNNLNKSSLLAALDLSRGAWGSLTIQLPLMLSVIIGKYKAGKNRD
jgi:hypothetical protein